MVISQEWRDRISVVDSLVYKCEHGMEKAKQDLDKAKSEQAKVWEELDEWLSKYGDSKQDVDSGGILRPQQESMSLPKRIMARFMVAPEKTLTMDGLRDLVTKKQIPTLRSTLYRLVKDEKLEKVGFGKYRLKKNILGGS